MNTSVPRHFSGDLSPLVGFILLLGLLGPLRLSFAAEAPETSPQRPSPWQFAANVVLDGSQSLAGSESKQAVGRGLLDLNLTVTPVASPAGEPFVKGYAQFLTFRGRNESAELGWLQGQSNIDAARMNRIGELWAELRPLAGLLRLKFGQVDASTEFAAVSSASDFINNSAGTSPTVFSLPAYPEPALGFNAFATVSDHVQFGLGCYGDALRAVSGHGFRRPFWVAESAISGRVFFGRGRLALGAWHDRHDFEHRDGTRTAGATGGYALAEQTLWEDSSVSNAPRALTLFWQYGRSPEAVSPVANHLAFGLNATGLWPARSADAIGIYWSRARPGGVTAPAAHADETVVEIYYKYQFLAWLNLQPDLQWVQHPGGARSADQALIVMLRSTAKF